MWQMMLKVVVRILSRFDFSRTHLGTPPHTLARRNRAEHKREEQGASDRHFGAALDESPARLTELWAQVVPRLDDGIPPLPDKLGYGAGRVACRSQRLGPQTYGEHECQKCSKSGNVCTHLKAT